MSLLFDLRRVRAYELEFGAGGQRLGCKFLLDDGSLVFVGESEITSEIETLIGLEGIVQQPEGMQLSLMERAEDTIYLWLDTASGKKSRFPACRLFGDAQK